MLQGVADPRRGGGGGAVGVSQTERVVQ
jgi:hypothetical protein